MLRRTIAIDEAHTVLEWGDDFRPAFSVMMRVLATRCRIPVVIATATAPDNVVERLRSALQLYDLKVFQTSIDKPLLQTRFLLLHKASFRGAELVASEVELPMFSGVCQNFVTTVIHLCLQNFHSALSGYIRECLEQFPGVQILAYCQTKRGAMDLALSLSTSDGVVCSGIQFNS